jgi:hypothetical protein
MIVTQYFINNLHYKYSKDIFQMHFRLVWFFSLQVRSANILYGRSTSSGTSVCICQIIWR